MRAAALEAEPLETPLSGLLRSWAWSEQLPGNPFSRAAWEGSTGHGEAQG